MPWKTSRDQLLSYCVPGLVTIAVIGILYGILGNGDSLLAAAVAIGILIWFLERR